MCPGGGFTCFISSVIDVDSLANYCTQITLAQIFIIQRPAGTKQNLILIMWLIKYFMNLWAPFLHSLHVRWLSVAVYVWLLFDCAFAFRFAREFQMMNNFLFSSISLDFHFSSNVFMSCEWKKNNKIGSICMFNVHGCVKCMHFMFAHSNGRGKTHSRSKIYG